jgi:hypothetical protein
MPIPQSMEALLAHTLLDAITKRCITDVPPDDSGRTDQVVLGKLTRELRDENVIAVHMQHPLGPSIDRDGMAGAPRNQDQPWDWPPETLGGMRTERIDGAVEIRLRKKLEYTDAVDIFAVVIQRVKDAINREESLRTLTDQMGNTMSIIEAFEAPGYAAGGGNVSINIRWVNWRAFVHSTNARG